MPAGSASSLWTIPSMNAGAMPKLRAIWKAWDQDPVSVSNRRFLYRLGTPPSFAGLILFLTIGQWVLAGFMVAILAITLEAGARSPGTRAHRMLSHFRRRA